MCMQCVAQGAPMVGVAVTMLNRRNIKAWAVNLRSGRPDGDGEAAPAPTSGTTVS